MPFIEQAFKWGMPIGRHLPLRFGPSALAGLLLACGAVPRGAPATPVEQPGTELEQVLREAKARSGGARHPLVTVSWSYRAGAPLAAPAALGADGGVVVGSVDGYLHALRPDGSFRWGYTLRGPLTGRAAVAPNGEVFAAADPNGLYALDPDGTLAWVSSIVGGITSAPILDRQARVWVTTGQGTLLGFSSRGGIVGYARFGNERTLGPAALAGGGVAIASVNGALKVAGNRAFSARMVAPAPVVELDSGPDALFVLGGEGLSRFDTPEGEERWSRGDVARVACSEPALVVVDERGLGWLSPRGELVAHVDVALGPHRPVACLPDGELLVADDAGNLVRLDRTGVKARAKLPEGRLLSLDPRSDGIIVAAYRDGRVLGLRLID